MSSFVSLMVGAACLGSLAGCGSNGPSQTTPATPAAASMTSVTLLATATANDKLSLLDLSLNSLTLTNASGKTTTVVATPQAVEFTHLNGSSEPLLTVSVPADTYTAATATVGSAQFSCNTLNATGGLDTGTFAYGMTPETQVTVNLPAPVTISGDALGLSLNLLVSSSVTYASCTNDGNDPFSITPTFALSTVALPSQATSNVTGLQGLVSAVNTAGSSFTLTTSDGLALAVNLSSNTVFQGVSASASLATGMPVDLDAAVQTDGSVTASRVEVLDTNTGNLSYFSGPLLFVADGQPTISVFGRLGQGYLLLNSLGGLGTQDLSYGSANFQLSGQLMNVSKLPFPAIFTAATMVPGQNVTSTTHATQISGGPLYVPATTLTLMPQTIDGTVVATASSGSFQTYTVNLASYALFSALATQAAQKTLLSNPNTVVIYVDSSAQQNNTAPIATGTTARFTGLVFNDNGTLRMDASSVEDGLAE